MRCIVVVLLVLTSFCRADSLADFSSFWLHQGKCSYDYDGDSEVNLRDFAVLSWILSSVCMAAKPVLVRDPFCDHKLYAYISADSAGEYYSRIDFHVPKDDRKNYAKYCVVDQIWYGKVRPGLQSAGVGGAGWATSGTWVYDAGNGWNYRSNAVQNSYMEIVIPSGYDRIHFLSYNVASGNGAMLAFAWDDGSTTGLSATSYDQGANGSGLREVVLATSASPDGVKKLRITHNDTSGTARIVGIRAWDTDGDGDPSTNTGTETAWLGHDLVDKYADASFYRNVVTGADSTVYKIGNRQAAYEYAFSLAPDGQAVKFTGTDQHYGTGQAQYTYHAGSDYLTNGPDIFADGTDKGGTWEIGRNYLIVADTITMRSTGYVDYDEGADEDADEPDATQVLTISATGITFLVTHTFNADYDVTTSNYCPMFLFNSPDIADNFVVFPAGTKTLLSVAEDTTVEGSEAMVTLKAGCTINFWQNTPSEGILYVASSDKIYGKVKTAEQFGGANPAAGDIQVLSGGFSITKTSELPDLYDITTYSRFRSRY